MPLPNNNSQNNLAKFCNDGTNELAFVFDGTNFAPSCSIVRGAETKYSIDLTHFYIPLEKYQTFAFRLEADQSVELSSKIILNSDSELQFIGIFVRYPDVDMDDCLIDKDEKYITYEYPIGGTVLPIGKVMMLSGSTMPGFGWNLNVSPGGFLLTNPHWNFDVEMTILVFE